MARGAPLTVGLSVWDLAGPDLLDLARAADEAGFDAVWLGEHVVLPTGYRSDHPTSGQAGEHHTGPVLDPGTELLEPFTALGAVAGATTRLGLATGIHLPALRHPLLTARAAATLAELSGGRFVLGVGAGWLEEEFDALGVPFAERGARLEEAVAVLRAAWRGGPFRHDGRHFRFGPVQLSARPVDVPVVLGGNTDRALRRAVAVGDGWFASGTPTLDEAVRLRDRVEELAGRPFPTWFRVAAADPRLVERYRAAGIGDVVVWADQVWRGDGPAERRRSLVAAAGALGAGAG